MRALNEQVMVITGASSGIGRCTALEAGKRGAKVVLAARSAGALESLRAEIEAAGGEAFAVPTDVSDAAQVEELGLRAVERFGRIDTWFNDAGVGMVAEFKETTYEEFRRIVDVNLMGVVYGSSVAMRRMGDEGGTIINMASVEANRALPLHAAYAASKHAVEGFSEALRMELEHAGSPIRVVVLKPASIDTPFFANARTKLGVVPKPIPPVYDPILVAEAALHAAETPARDMIVGGFGAVLSANDVMMPRVVDKQLELVGYPMQETDEPKSEAAPDNLFTPSPHAGETRGGWNGRTASLYRTLQLNPGMRRAAIGGAAAAGFVVGRSLLRKVA